ASFGAASPSDVLAPPRHPREPDLVDRDAHAHGDVGAATVVLDKAVDWTAFGIWLTMLLQARGSQVYRVKGLLDVGGEGAGLLNGVQHVVHPPVHLDAWPDDEHRSRLVFIGESLDRDALTRSLEVFSRARLGY